MEEEGYLLANSFHRIHGHGESSFHQSAAGIRHDVVADDLERHWNVQPATDVARRNNSTKQLQAAPAANVSGIY